MVEPGKPIDERRAVARDALRLVPSVYTTPGSKAPARPWGGCG